MPASTKSNFKIYNEYTQTGYVETLQQVSEVFGGASQGAINIISRPRMGEVDYESFFPSDTAGFISRRDPASVADAADTGLTQSEDSGVKVNRKIGPVATTLDSLKKIQKGGGYDEDALNFAVGVQAAKGAQLEMCNTALRALRSSLVNQAAVYVNASADAGLTSTHLVDGLAKFGDAAGRITLWVMHSKTYFDLVKDQITQKIEGLTNFVMAGATPATMNRPVLVTDSPSLIVADGISAGVNAYHVLGLTHGAFTIEDSEEETIASEIALGKENLIVRMQGEYAYNIRMKGYTWDVSNGGVNPSDTAIGTGTNWDKTATDYKNTAGVVIRVK